VEQNEKSYKTKKVRFSEVIEIKDGYTGTLDTETLEGIELDPRRPELFRQAFDKDPAFIVDALDNLMHGPRESADDVEILRAANEINKERISKLIDSVGALEDNEVAYKATIKDLKTKNIDLAPVGDDPALVARV
jgi:hypothetical protein